MKKNVLAKIYETLKVNKLVNNEREFCEDWLGRSEGYIRGLRFYKREVSAGTLALCASKLQHYGERLSETRAHKSLGEEFIRLSNDCYNDIYRKSRERWMV